MGITVRDTEQYIVELGNRMTFHFGNVSIDRAKRTIIEVDLDIDGEIETGLAMGTIGSAWFLKDPSLTLTELVQSFLDVTAAARERAEELPPSSSVFELWRELFDRQREWAEGTDFPPLLWGYGVSLLEQAAVDAFCRHAETTFHEAIRDGTLGLELGAFYDELAGEDVTDLLPDRPQRSAAIRHTVGLSDPLTDEDVAPEDRLDDGLPQTVTDYIEQEGVRYFKIKLGADLESDRSRLRRIADVIAETGIEEFAFTVDANESYESAASFREQWSLIAADPELTSFLENLLYVEQPLPRHAAFSDETRRVFGDWDESPPIIIDESDDLPDRLGTALDCGYAGTSHKNCKGVFKGVANSCLIEHRRRTDPDGEYVISGEDLTTLGPIELQEDFAVTATLGMDHVERNGHHYFTGLSAFSDDLQEAVLHAHGDLFYRHERGFVTLDIEDGEVGLDSVVDAPFGHDVDVDLSEFTPVSEWSVDSLSD